MHYVNHYNKNCQNYGHFQGSGVYFIDSIHNHGRFCFIKRGRHVTGSHPSHNN